MSELLERLQAALGAAYHLERELGGGGMSRVFVAQETALGRKVVLKVLPPELGAGLSVDRFRREIQLAASLHHPNIVPLPPCCRSPRMSWTAALLLTRLPGCTPWGAKATARSLAWNGSWQDHTSR